MRTGEHYTYPTCMAHPTHAQVQIRLQYTCFILSKNRLECH